MVAAKLVAVALIPAIRALILSPAKGHNHRQLQQLPPAQECPPYTSLTGQLPLEFEMSNPFVGGQGENRTCVWEIAPAELAQGGTLGIAFMKIDISEEDYLDVVDPATGEYLTTYWGEYMTPHIFREPHLNALTLEFVSDLTHRAADERYHAGFKGVVFDSSQGQCYNDCSGHGICQEGWCYCDRTWYGDDCSVEIPFIQSGQSIAIQDIAPGDWVYYQFNLTQHSYVVVEFLDSGHEASSPYLLVNSNSPPTLTEETFDEADWFSWWFDASDLHFIEKTWPAGEYFVGVTNHRDRAAEPSTGSLTLRTSLDAPGPCVGDCFGHGKCSTDPTALSYCVCDMGWTGTWCRHELTPLILGETITGTLRIGDWTYFLLEMPERYAQRQTLDVFFTSNSRRAYPACFIRRDQVPELDSRYLPTYDAFIMDFGDAEGFDLLQGQRQQVTIPKQNLTAGVYYIGIFNLWGYTGLSNAASHESLEFTLYADLYPVGLPCAREADEFCMGYPCDFNTGKCMCPSERVGKACATLAHSLFSDTGSPVQHEGSLAPGETRYFYATVTAAMAEKNLAVEMRRTEADQLDVETLLLARKGNIPSSANYTLWDDHDLTARYYHESVHTIVLDRDELTPGIWYFALMNMVDSEHDLAYALTAQVADQLPCPKHRVTGETCSGHGECILDLGRCRCQPGFTFDDCSAEGVFHLDPFVAVAGPSIDVDGWAFFSLAVGCRGVSLSVMLTHDGATPSGAPLLTLRRGALPLMSEGSNDYYDMFQGMSRHSLNQGVTVSGCIKNLYEGPERECVVLGANMDDSQQHFGTHWATGFPEPGVYFVGIYNDIKAQAGTYSNYSVNYWINGTCQHCASGFLMAGGQCEVCPGLVPLNSYSNAPVATEAVCSDRGRCQVQGDAEVVCSCETGFLGPECALSCPGLVELDDGSAAPCHGHGACSIQAGVPTCACQAGYRGEDCGLLCPGTQQSGEACSGRGACGLTPMPQGQSTTFEATCTCRDEAVGPDCSAVCPNACSGRGACEAIRHNDGVIVPRCNCEPGYLSADCSTTCPGLLVGGQVCGGNGTCSLSSDGVAVCTCFQGSKGEVCNETSTQIIVIQANESNGTVVVDVWPASQPAALSLGSLAIVALVVGIIFCIVLVSCAILCVVAERRRRELTQMKAPLIGEAHTTKSGGHRALASQELSRGSNDATPRGSGSSLLAGDLNIHMAETTEMTEMSYGTVSHTDTQQDKHASVQAGSKAGNKPTPRVSTSSSGDDPANGHGQEEEATV